MPTFPLRPQGPGFWQGWTSFAGAPSAWQAVDDSGDSTNDGDATTLLLPRLSGPGGIVSFPAFDGIGSPGPVNSVMVRCVAKRSAAAHPDLLIGFARGVLVAFGAAFTPGAGYTEATRTFAVNPWSGQPWKAADLPGLELCVQSQTGQIGSNVITLVNGLIDIPYPAVYRGVQPRNAQLG